LEGGRAERLAEALEAAERAARGYLEASLGRRLGDFDVTLKVEEGEDGVRLVVDVSVRASKSLPRHVADALVDEAVERARRAFEEVYRRGASRG